MFPTCDALELVHANPDFCQKFGTILEDFGGPRTDPKWNKFGLPVTDK
jgi:hypothetical protein